MTRFLGIVFFGLLIIGGYGAICAMILRYAAKYVGKIQIAMSRAYWISVLQLSTNVGAILWLVMTFAPSVRRVSDGMALAGAIVSFFALWPLCAFAIKDSRGDRVGGFVGFLIAVVALFMETVIGYALGRLVP